MNSAYVVSAAAMQAGLPLRSEWHGHTIPGDPQGRWLVVVNHIDDTDEASMVGAAGVTQLPSMLNPSPLPQAWVNALNAWGVGVTTADTIATAFDKLRAKWPKAAAVWR